MKKINAKLIKAMNPCKNRFNNFIKEYPKFNGTFNQFLSLDNITYDDKVWVAVRMLSKNQLVHWSIACAESVQYIYNEKYPKNMVLIELFSYLGKIDDFEKLTETEKTEIIRLRDAAAAAYAADYAAAAEEQRNLNLLFLASLTNY